MEHKLELIEEALDLDENVITPETVLEDLEEWDSMAKLSLIAMIDDEYDKVLEGSQIAAFETVQDILDIMHE